MNTTNINNPKSFDIFPTGRICAILDNIETASSALDAMIAAGIKKDDIEICFGKEGAKILDADATRHGVFASIRKAFRVFGDEENKLMHIYEGSLEKDKYVMTIKTGFTDEKKEKVKEILIDHSAHNINYFGAFIVEGMSTT